MISTKLQRLTSRGALGNGLRVVVGAVLASEGSLVVTTRNRRLVLEPNPRDGSTTVVEDTEVDHPVGTRVEIGFGPAPAARRKDPAVGERSDPHGRPRSDLRRQDLRAWYDPTTFHELLTASRALPVRGLIERFDGCSGAKAGKVVEAAGLLRTTCENVTRKEAERLLEAARENTRPVKASRLGEVGPEAFLGHAYAIKRGIAHSAAALRSPRFRSAPRHGPSTSVDRRARTAQRTASPFTSTARQRRRTSMSRGTSATSTSSAAASLTPSRWRARAPASASG